MMPDDLERDSAADREEKWLIKNGLLDPDQPTEAATNRAQQGELIHLAQADLGDTITFHTLRYDETELVVTGIVTAIVTTPEGEPIEWEVGRFWPNDPQQLVRRLARG